MVYGEVSIHFEKSKEYPTKINLFIFQNVVIKLIKMKLDTLIRSFLIAILVPLIVVIIEAAYYGLNPENTSAISSVGYSISSPFFTNFSDLTSPVNLAILGVIFICTFVIALVKISKQERARKDRKIRPWT